MAFSPDQRLPVDKLHAVADAATPLLAALRALNTADVGRLAWENEYGVAELDEQPGAYLLTRQALDQVVGHLISGRHLQQRFVTHLIEDGAVDVWQYLSRWESIGPRHWHVETASSDCDGPRYSSYLTCVDPYDEEDSDVTVKVRSDGILEAELHEPHDEGYRSWQARLCYDSCDLDERSQRDVFAEQMGY